MKRSVSIASKGSAPRPPLSSTSTFIASGFTADVFVCAQQETGLRHDRDNERVLKLFHPWVDRATAEREFHRTRAVHAAGASCPAVYELVEFDERNGIIFERIDGDSMVDRVAKRPWALFAAARQMAELHAKIHDQAAPAELPSQREQLARRIQNAQGFSDAEKQRALQHAARLPEASEVGPAHCAPERLCHGDFHPGNILFNHRNNNQPVIIDWSAATRGLPLADVARTSVLFEQAEIPDFVPLRIRIIMKFARRLLHRCYLQTYLKLRPGSTLDEIEFWRVPQRFAGAAWLAAKRAAIAKIQGGESAEGNRQVW